MFSSSLLGFAPQLGSIQLGIWQEYGSLNGTLHHHVMLQCPDRAGFLHHVKEASKKHNMPLDVRVPQIGSSLRISYQSRTKSHVVWFRHLAVCLGTAWLIGKNHRWAAEEELSAETE